MLQSRKRKVSPDKKVDKYKKLKVSNKIFRSPAATKSNNEAKLKLEKLLPDDYESIILSANIKPVEFVEENEAIFGCIRLPIHTKEEAVVWIKKFERKTFTKYHSQRTWKKDDNTGLFKRKYICNFQDSSEQSNTNTCKGSIIFTLKDEEEIQANPDYYLRDYPSQVIIHFCHNHKIASENLLKNIPRSTKLHTIFGNYFAKGHSPFSALICHKCDLHSLYAEEFYNVISDTSICPSYNWCLHHYEALFKKQFADPSEDELYDNLKEIIEHYNIKCRSECAVLSENPLLVLSICTPLMKSIFNSGFAEDFITVRCFSTPKSIQRQKLILFSCHTPIGSLPFGVVISLAEGDENLCVGIKSLFEMLDRTTYSPKTIITEEDILVSNSLKQYFPNSQVIFNEFQLRQSIWRIARVMFIDNDEQFEELYNQFLITLKSKSEQEFKENFVGLLAYAERFSKLSNFLKYFKSRANSYVHYSRPNIDLITDVFNYIDSGTIILQDVSVKYGNFINIVQLFDFLTNTYMLHYERKLNKIIQGDLEGFFKTNFYVTHGKICEFTCKKKSDIEFLVSWNGIKFFVNTELDTCTCQVGVQGGSCIHQYIVEKKLGLAPEYFTPLCEEILDIFKNIIKDKTEENFNSISDFITENGNELDSSNLEITDAGEFSLDMMAGASETEYNEEYLEEDDLGPVDEVFLEPSDINDSFNEEIISPSNFYESDESPENSIADFDHNAFSGELQSIDAAHEIQTTGDYNEEVIEYSNEVETVEYVEFDKTEDLRTEMEDYRLTDSVEEATSGIYSYPLDTQRDEFYEGLMTESDKKTAEIAEFLTNLPDTNNCGPSENDETIQDLRTSTTCNAIKTTKLDRNSSSNGVVVVSNEEYFTNYEMLENNVLSDENDENIFSGNFVNDANNYEINTQPSSHELITDSYEENNLVMISPNDIFDDNQSPGPDINTNKQEGKINVLSSVVIRPSNQINPNLNAVKYKSLRNMKEKLVDSSKTSNSENATFAHDNLTSEQRSTVLPMLNKKLVNSCLKEETCKVQDKELNLKKDKDVSVYQMLKQNIFSEKSCRKPKHDSKLEQRNEKLGCVFGLREAEFTQSKNSPKLVKSLPIGKKQTETPGLDTRKTPNVDKDVDNNSDQISDVEGYTQSYYVSDSEEDALSNCHPDKLARNNDLDEVEGIDSDELEELAAQNYDKELITAEDILETNSSKTLSPRKSLKIPLKKSSKILPIKHKSMERENCEYTKKVFPSSKKRRTQNYILQEHLMSTFSQMESLVGRCYFRKSFQKYMSKQNHSVISDTSKSISMVEKLKKIRNLQRVLKSNVGIVSHDQSSVQANTVDKLTRNKYTDQRKLKIFHNEFSDFEDTSDSDDFSSDNSSDEIYEPQYLSDEYSCTPCNNLLPTNKTNFDYSPKKRALNVSPEYNGSAKCRTLRNKSAANIFNQNRFRNIVDPPFRDSIGTIKGKRRKILKSPEQNIEFDKYSRSDNEKFKKKSSDDMNMEAHNSEVNCNIQNTDLSFLFDDPRFETIVHKEISSNLDDNNVKKHLVEKTDAINHKIMSIDKEPSKLKLNCSENITSINRMKKARLTSSNVCISENKALNQTVNKPYLYHVSSTKEKMSSIECVATTKSCNKIKSNKLGQSTSKNNSRLDDGRISSLDKINYDTTTKSNRPHESKDIIFKKVAVNLGENFGEPGSISNESISRNACFEKELIVSQKKNASSNKCRSIPKSPEEHLLKNEFPSSCKEVLISTKQSPKIDGKKSVKSPPDKTNVDIENSIAAIVLNKGDPRKKRIDLTENKNKIVSSTPIKSVGYEKEFKMFLENSRSSTDLGTGHRSDVGSFISGNNLETNRGREKTITSISKRNILEKIKKSVSWAEGLNVIEYSVGSGESDDSEIKSISNEIDLEERTRKQAKEKSIIFSSKNRRDLEKPKKVLDRETDPANLVTVNKNRSDLEKPKKVLYKETDPANLVTVAKNRRDLEKPKKVLDKETDPANLVIVIKNRRDLEKPKKVLDKETDPANLVTVTKNRRDLGKPKKVLDKETDPANLETVTKNRRDLEKPKKVLDKETDTANLVTVTINRRDLEKTANLVTVTKNRRDLENAKKVLDKETDPANLVTVTINRRDLEKTANLVTVTKNRRDLEKPKKVLDKEADPAKLVTVTKNRRDLEKPKRVLDKETGTANLVTVTINRGDLEKTENLATVTKNRRDLEKPKKVFDKETDQANLVTVTTEGTKILNKSIFSNDKKLLCRLIRYDNPKIINKRKNLVVLLNKNKDLDERCRVSKSNSSRKSYNRRDHRIGYQELLNRAKTSKLF